MRYCVHDGPGIRTTVFLKGCPLRCWWCHNPEGLSPRRELIYREDRCLKCGDCVTACPNGANASGNGSIHITRELCRQCGACVDRCVAEARELIGKIMSVNEVMKEIEKDIPFFDESGGGVTFSGGEPLLQPEFLLDLLKACRHRHIHTTVDTSGYAPPALLAEVREFTDLFLFDLKSMNDAVHRENTGVSNELILTNLRMLAARGSRIQARLPLIPGVNDTASHLTDAGTLLSSLGLRDVQVLPFHLTGIDKYPRLGLQYKKPGTIPPTHDNVEAAAARLRSFNLSVAIGG